MGRRTASATYQPASDNPKTNAGKIKNIINKYTMANHLYFDVSMPKNFAIGIGNLMKGMG